MKNKKIYIILIIILVFQLLIPVFFLANEKNIVKNGKMGRFQIESLQLDLKNQSVGFKIKTVRIDNRKINTEQAFEGLSNNKRLSAYAVKTYTKTSLNYLQIIDREDTVGENTIINNLCRTDIVEMPYNYISGDEIRVIRRDTDLNEPLSLEADISYLNGDCIVNKIYINGSDYMDYVNANYYDLLKQN